MSVRKEKKEREERGAGAFLYTEGTGVHDWARNNASTDD
jgi:hypothetical protein